MNPIAKPSSWLDKGILIEKVNSVNLFKFTDELHARMQELIDKKQADSLTQKEASELEAIGELIIIVTYMNGMIASAAQQPQESETWKQRLDKN
ncbi:hypothetical protein NIES21_25020 [Anabaenopsis circularis NIES-21]|uniref:Uncharacterized protein n=1 Tax=Anabaenopsis circularis NIES-21 TaxID=1085406 RepID=A0A1Z4GGQ4_9CYAN|nr:hypothetical protein NIES21_25020 [Anabaenopsis circularis NIES-21]